MRRLFVNVAEGQADGGGGVGRHLVAEDVAEHRQPASVVVHWAANVAVLVGAVRLVGTDYLNGGYLAIVEHLEVLADGFEFQLKID